jgi:hypothetical protein
MVPNLSFVKHVINHLIYMNRQEVLHVDSSNSLALESVLLEEINEDQ